MLEREGKRERWERREKMEACVYAYNERGNMSDGEVELMNISS